MTRQTLRSGVLTGFLVTSFGGLATAAPPPALDCIGNQEACAGPVWPIVQFDCITGDHYDKDTSNCSWLPSSRCDQPDILLDDTAELIRCDDWLEDFWERPNSPGGDFQHQLDIVYVLASETTDWYFFLIQLYGLTGGKLDAAYAIELDTDPGIDPSTCGRQEKFFVPGHDDSPCPGVDPAFPDGVSCSDWLLRSSSPTANILEKVGANAWGEEGVVAFFDSDDDLGGTHCARNDQFVDSSGEPVGGSTDPWSGSGAETLVDDQVSGGSHPDGLWTMMPSDCQALAPEGYQEELLGIDPEDLPGIDLDGSTCVVLAVSKEMLADTVGALDPVVPFTFRAWSAKGEQDNQNVQLHDKFTDSQSGDAYRDEPNFPPSTIKELDSSARLGFLPGFSQSCPEIEAQNELQVYGQYQSFTGAVVPVLQSDSLDAVFFTSFLPVQSESRWPGRVHQFIQPVPFTLVDVDGDGDDDFVPDVSTACSDAEDTACLAWSADTAILSQAPDPDQVAGSRQIGPSVDQRRITYTQGPSFSPEGAGGVPRGIALFDYPASGDPAAIDLAQGLGMEFNAADDAELAAAKSQTASIIRQTVAERTAPDPAGGADIVFVVGDSFHAEATLVGAPTRFFYLAADLESNGSACDDTADPNPGYRCFFERSMFRRKVLLVPSNDGQVHGYDAGFFRGSIDSDDRLTGAFDRGTGHELFAHIPRPMLRHSAELTLTDHSFGIDFAPVVDDFFLDPRHDGTPTTTEREWRTVAIGGFGRGDRGYYALDMTRPDHLDVESVVNVAGLSDVAFLPDDGGNYVPTCTSGFSTEACGPVPYPSVLWEFSDQCSGSPCDEEVNGIRDLGLSWSRVNTGRVKVDVGGTVQTRFVAIFGGGYDPDFPGASGNWIYMLDVETGSVLYKRLLEGAAPAEPAAVDTNQDSILDVIYQTTTAGFVYKIDLTSPGTVDALTGRVESGSWNPFKIFSTGGRPIFFPPTVIFVGGAGQYALAFGTGDVDDVFSEETPAAGRFHVVLDQGFTAATVGLPLTEASYERIVADDVAEVGNFLLNPLDGRRPGWILELTAHEKLVSQPLAISGLLAFTTFATEAVAVDGVPVDPISGDACAAGVDGTSRVYALLTTNANAIQGSARYIEVESFASQPYVLPSSVTATQSQSDSYVSPFDSAEMQAARDALKALFPANCRFGGFSLQVAVNLSSGSVQAIADVPQCIVNKNWKEF